MKGIQLKLREEWIVLPDDFSLNIEQTNPLFNDQGTFSFPFEVPLELNRSIFLNIDDPFSKIDLEYFDGMDAELWFYGTLLYKGIIEIDQEIELENNISMTFISGNSNFMNRIKDLNAQSVPLDREIKLGYVVNRVIPPFSKIPEEKQEFIKIHLPENIMMNYTEYNISEPYPISEFCNIRVCASNEKGKYKILDAKRPFSGVCFYLLYFLDLLFEYLDIHITRNDLKLIEDMKRVCFITTKCEHYISDIETDAFLSEIASEDFAGKNFKLEFHKDKVGDSPEVTVLTNEFIYKKKNVFATNKNFPDVLVKDIIDDFNNAFGIRFIQDVNSNNMKIVSLKNILTDTDTINLSNKVLSYVVSKEKKQRIVLTYGISDDTSFNYDDYTNVKEYNNYKDILKAGISSYSKECAIDKTTGNAYRVKVNKDTGGSPSLFEVGGYRDYKARGYHKAEENEISINFSPAIMNDTTGWEQYKYAIADTIGGQSQEDMEFVDPLYAFFADVELIDKSVYDGFYESSSNSKGKIFSYKYLRANAPEQYDEKEHEISPLRTYDSGYTLGIMRGPGSSSKIEYIGGVDEEGNRNWVQTASNYALTSDTCDNYGNFFDYNGLEAGGADQSERFSLKLVAEKNGFDIDSKYANRGLVSKFLTEYMYFLEKRKTITMEVDMDITELIGINMFKRYKIGNFVGFINRISYSLTINGLDNVIIEMYTI